MFQSPYGDYLVRNVAGNLKLCVLDILKFQSPYGDYLVRNEVISNFEKLLRVSVPLRGLLS